MLSDDPRAYEPLTRDHLRKLGRIAREYRESLFKRYPRYAVFRDRILCVALCQGGALHYLNGVNGVKDLDVWTFYAAVPEQPELCYPWRARAVREFGSSELTGWSERVDVLGRTLPYSVGVNPTEMIGHYFTTNWNSTPQHLKRKPVVLIEPEERLGEIIWPPTTTS